MTIEMKGWRLGITLCKLPAGVKNRVSPAVDGHHGQCEMGIQGRAVQAIPLAATSHGALQAVSEDLET